MGIGIPSVRAISAMRFQFEKGGDVNHCWVQNIFVTPAMKQLLKAEAGFEGRNDKS